jgi:hypothetical protein
MITLLEARNVQGSLLGLTVDDVSEGLVLEDVDGLHPVKATIVSSSFANLDKQEYQSSRRESRDITITIGLEPDYTETTVSDLRKRLYGYFMPKSAVNLRLVDSDDLEVEINGRVESCEAPLWAKEPQMIVVVRCLDSDFVELDPTVVPGNTVSTVTEFEIDYDGNVETGFEFVLNVNRTLGAFSVYQTPPDNSSRVIEFEGSLVAGDTLTITTIPGEKEVVLTHSGVDTSVLYAISPQSNWLELMQGVNKFRVYATGAAIPFTITYKTRYGGL